MPSPDSPVIGGFFPDPSVCRVGEDYYLACSSFEYFPGVPIFTSRDLVSWRQIGNVLDRPSQLPLGPETPASGGIYAPTLRYHDGRFWLITTNERGGGNFIVTADDPAGPWSDPVWLNLDGIDPDLAWDDDGSCWCAFSAVGPHVQQGGIRLARIDPLSGKVLESPTAIWSGTGLQYPEAPHFYRVDGWWYLLIAEGGTERGHAVSIARARSPRGPFEPAPVNPILSHRSTDRPIQSTGHADLVTAPDGNWWMVLLGTRPKGMTPSFHVLGRETFLAPVYWENEWPVVGPVGVPQQAAAGIRDDFDAESLAPAWISPRTRPDEAWSLTERPGRLTLHATGETLDRPGHTFFGQRQQHHDCRFTTRLDPGTARAGISVRLDEAHHYDLEIAEGYARVIARIGPLCQCVGEVPVDPGELTLSVDFRTTDVLPPTVTHADEKSPLGVRGTGPDTISFLVGETVLAQLDGRYLSTEVATGFTGRVVGLYVTAGTASFDSFECAPRVLR